ncbi:hypothetical protein [Noviherbaspirillum denitrificans]|uniref:Uncharacterized protein n=1 Tax=Noviherbaspirillum denitrificans TaxID=1968433 RepID=A0A254TI30_9BURK|nr:hypothetical protein [Noviherbaspirillum denitrificans]OWW21857.1 hypothetical protein AYR66_22520 [Noviherbaspirillum denitrificans]
MARSLKGSTLNQHLNNCALIKMNEANVLMLNAQKKVLLHSLQTGDFARLRELFDCHIRSIAQLNKLERVNIDELSDAALKKVVIKYLDDEMMSG